MLSRSCSSICHYFILPVALSYSSSLVRLTILSNSGHHCHKFLIVISSISLNSIRLRYTFTVQSFTVHSFLAAFPFITERLLWWVLPSPLLWWTIWFPLIWNFPLTVLKPSNSDIPNSHFSFQVAIPNLSYHLSARPFSSSPHPILGALQIHPTYYSISAQMIFSGVDILEYYNIFIKFVPHT